jgi:hypothetical protein
MDPSDGRHTGPWPEPDPSDGDRADDAIGGAAEAIGADAATTAAALDDAGDRVVDELDDVDDMVAAWDDRTDPKGSRGVGLAIAGLQVGYLMILPVLLVVSIYAFITVYAIVKAVRAGSDSADPTIVLLGVVGLVTLFVLLLGVAGWAIGRAADPKKRR